MKTTNAVLTPSPVIAIVGESHWARAARQQVQTIAQNAENVLIVGPEGAGKQSLARCIHAASPRFAKPFILLSCNRFSAGSLFDSQVFGHLPEAFAGLKASALGLIQAAHGGTLFLDEVDSLPLDSQDKLFHALSEQLVIPLGGREGIPIDVRVIASTTIHLLLAVSAGKFRKDLLDLLAANSLELPPLAERFDDVPAIAQQLAEQIAEKRNQLAKRFDESAIRWMRSYAWPGNTGELRSVLEIVTSSNADVITDGLFRIAMKQVHPRLGIYQRASASGRFAGFAAIRAAMAPGCRLPG